MKTDNEQPNIEKGSFGQLVSIIIPVYNAEEFLPECIESVIRQSYTNIEIILVDDGSADGSGRICDAYAKNNVRISVYHKENNGLSSARNFGLDRAVGTWIAFVDSDDRIETDMIRSMLEAALRHGADLCVCGFIVFDRRREIIGHAVQMERCFSGDSKTEAYLNGIIQNYSWNKLYRKELFRDIRFPEDRNYEDIITTFRILQSVARVVCIPDRLYLYRRQKNSITNIHMLKNETDRWLAIKEIFDLVPPDQHHFHIKMVKYCTSAIWRSWLALGGASQEEKYHYSDRLQKMRNFVRDHKDEIFHGNYRLYDKFRILLVSSNSSFFHSLFYFIWNIRNKYRMRNYY